MTASTALRRFERSHPELKWGGSGEMVVVFWVYSHPIRRQQPIVSLTMMAVSPSRGWSDRVELSVSSRLASQAGAAAGPPGGLVVVTSPGCPSSPPRSASRRINAESSFVRLSDQLGALSRLVDDLRIDGASSPSPTRSSQLLKLTDSSSQTTFHPPAAPVIAAAPPSASPAAVTVSRPPLPTAVARSPKTPLSPPSSNGYAGDASLQETVDRLRRQLEVKDLALREQQAEILALRKRVKVLEAS